MNDDEPLAEKIRTQKLLDDMAQHDLAKYVSDTHSRVEALAARFGLRLKYGTPTMTHREMEEKTTNKVSNP